jgi:thymidine kinase
VQVFKSHLDDRYSGVFRVSSHDGSELEAHPVHASVQIAELVRPDTEVVAIDEAQFLDDGVRDVVNALADRGVRSSSPGRTWTSEGSRSGPCPRCSRSPSRSTSCTRSVSSAATWPRATSG